MVHVHKLGRHAPSVYFIQAGKDGPIKIGSTTDVDARLRTHQIGNPEELHLLLTLPSDRGHGERQLHWLFRDLSIRGEWFRSEPRLLEYIEDWKRILWPEAMDRKATAQAALSVQEGQA